MSIRTSRPFKLVTLGIALAGAVLALLFSASTPASDVVPAGTKPKAVWDPASVSETIQPGQTKTVSVTLIADKNLLDSLVQVSPMIAPYVTVSPSTISEVQKGTSIPLALTISVPIDALPATATGTIALQKAKHTGDNGDDQEHEGKIIAQALPVSVDVVWPKATLSSGIIVTYPPTLTASVDADTGELSLIPHDQGIEGGGISVSVDLNPNRLSMADYYTGNPGADLGASVSTTSVAGRVGYIFEPRNTMACDVVVIVQNGDGSFVNIDDYGCGYQSNGIFDAVVHSIKLPN